MDNNLFQMILPFLPEESRDIFELHQLILFHANSSGENWQLEMLKAIRPKVREPHTIDVLIKCLELSMLLEKGRKNNGYRNAL